MPGTPSSRTRMFDPWPKSRVGTLSSWHRRTSAVSSSRLSGSAKYSAGPPNWNQVCIASGSLGRTIRSKPAIKLIGVSSVAWVRERNP